MKFSHSIQFNAVPEWTSHYIAYSNLKKLIFTLEKEINQGAQAVVTDGEASPLLNGARDDPDKIFSQALDRELEKVTSFFDLKEPEIFAEVEDLMKDAESFEADRDGMGGELARQTSFSRRKSTSARRKSSIFQALGFPKRRRTSGASHSLDRIDSDGSGEDNEERPALTKSKTTDTIDSGSRGENRRPSVDAARKNSAAFDDVSEQAISMAYDTGAILKKRMITLYVHLSELRSFVQLNKTGFTKVLKKYDKICDRKLRDLYISQNVETARTFKKEISDAIGDRLYQVEQMYATLSTEGNLEQARRELRLDLREHVVWERNTVWREMIGIERKAQAANLGVRRTLMDSSGNERLQGDEDHSGKSKEVHFVGRYRCPEFLLHSTFYVLLGTMAIFLVLLLVPIMESPEQQNCLAMVVFVSLLWATEAIPLFVTSLLVPFLAVILRVVRTDQKPHHRLETKAAASYVFAAMWTPVIILLLGGFTLAAALSKYNIAKMMATFVLSKAGTKPRNVLLTNMFVSMFASMWISNVASPVLCFSIIQVSGRRVDAHNYSSTALQILSMTNGTGQPILRNLPNDSNMIKALLLGIALSANIGGMASPIASPQNLIALENMEPEPGWGVWFFIALPVCIISILLIWLLLLVTLRPGQGTNIVPIRPMKDKFTGTQWFISAVTIVTILLWCVTHQLESIFGDMGVVAIIPIVLFFGTGILTKEDFNNFLWTIIILAAGGLALGKAVNSSGLLHTLAGEITARVEGLSLYAVLVVFSAMILVVASFISHTVAALIILPLVAQVGDGMSEPHPNLLVFGSVLMCSAAMALPTSGFPNMTAIMMEDSQTGQRYLKVSHFLTRGIPASILTFAVVISVGFGLMRAAGL